MGTRSDVALCMKNKVYQELSDAAKATIKDYFGDFENRTEEGLLFATHDVKWYHNCYGDLIQLYSELSDGEHEDFLIMVATPEYPDDNDADIGCWDDNPWDITKEVSVTLEWSPR